MPRAYHNLDGVLRDVEAAYRSEDGDGQLRWQRFVDIVEWALEQIEGPGAGDIPEGDDSALEDELDGDERQLSLADVPRARGHDEGRRHISAPASLLDRALDGLAGPERAQAIAELDSLRSNAVAAPRLSASPEVSDGKKPQGSKPSRSRAT